jgi:transposase
MTMVTVLSGPERRRRWATSEKLRIVEESVATEESVAEVARRHDIHPNLLHQWRRQARTGVLAAGLEAGPALGASDFAAVAVAPEQRVLSAPERPLACGVIEIELASGARVRIGGAVEATTIAATIAALLRGGRR